MNNFERTTEKESLWEQLESNNWKTSNGKQHQQLVMNICEGTPGKEHRVMNHFEGETGKEQLESNN